MTDELERIGKEADVYYLGIKYVEIYIILYIIFGLERATGHIP
jgi:hypothetical protein